MVWVLLTIWLGLVGVLVNRVMAIHKANSQMALEAKQVNEQVKPVLIKEKSLAQKQRVMDKDYDTMTYLGLYYDYDQMTLPELLSTYLEERGFDQDQIGVSYKNLETGELIGFNAYQPMIAASTYKLPINMLVVDGVEDRKFSMRRRYDITQSEDDMTVDYPNYLAQFGETMSISEMQEYSIVYSENAPAYGLIKMLGGYDKAFGQLSRYGESHSPDLKTISHHPLKTTSDYYIQVLEYLYDHQDKYQDLLDFMAIGFDDSYIRTLLPETEIYQKVGYYAEAQNAGAIVMEDTPYLVAIYTSELGVQDAENPEEWYGGATYVGELGYIINEWHRVNRN